MSFRVCVFTVKKTEIEFQVLISNRLRDVFEREFSDSLVLRGFGHEIVTRSLIISQIHFSNFLLSQMVHDKVHKWLVFCLQVCLLECIRG